MKSQIIAIVIAVLLAANILSFSVKTNLANAAVTCVDKYNYTSVIPCTDQNAIAAPAGYTPGVNMTSNMTASGGNMTQTTLPPVVASPPLVPPQQQGWTGTCNTLQPLLLQSCSELVNPDGTLTTQGDRAVGCIRNGLGLALVGISQGLPLPVIIDGLRALEGPTGCGNIVNWDQIQSVAQLQIFEHLFGH
jgi:hypothetical protein